MEGLDFKKYLKKTNFAKDTNRILNAFRIGKIHTYMDLQNAPIKLGAAVAGYSTYQLVAELNAAIAAEEVDDVPAIEEVAAASVAVESKPVKTEQLKKAPAADEKAGRRSKRGASADKAKSA